ETQLVCSNRHLGRRNFLAVSHCSDLDRAAGRRCKKRHKCDRALDQSSSRSYYLLCKVHKVQNRRHLRSSNQSYYTIVPGLISAYGNLFAP
ncbi:hypothetical protein TMatcc_005083, partial [Talaromyces marneffei ATCC 18224]